MSDVGANPARRQPPPGSPSSPSLPQITSNQVQNSCLKHVSAMRCNGGALLAAAALLLAAGAPGAGALSFIPPPSNAAWLACGAVDDPVRAGLGCDDRWEGGGGGDSPGLLALQGYPYGTEDGKLLKTVRNRFFPATPRTMRRFQRRGNLYADLIVRAFVKLDLAGRELAAAVVARAFAVARDLARSADTNKVQCPKQPDPLYPDTEALCLALKRVQIVGGRQIEAVEELHSMLSQLGGLGIRDEAGEPAGVVEALADFARSSSKSDRKKLKRYFQAINGLLAAGAALPELDFDREVLSEIVGRWECCYAAVGRPEFHSECCSDYECCIDPQEP